jgi:hypothetical protein
MNVTADEWQTGRRTVQSVGSGRVAGKVIFRGPSFDGLSLSPGAL